MVSTSSNTNAMRNGLLNTQAELYRMQQKALSQKNILSPSEDPYGTSVVMDANNVLSNIQSFKDNISYLDMGANVLDSVYGTVFDKLTRINDLALSAANGTNASKENMQGFYDEVKSLKEDIVRIANTQFDGEFIFSGANVAIPAYTLQEDGSIVYNGTKSIEADGTAIDGAEEQYARKIEVDDEVLVSVNNAGDSIFGTFDNSTDPPTGSGLFYTLSMLEKAMTPDDFNQDEIRGQLDSIQNEITNISSRRMQNGLVQNKISSIKDLLDNNELLTTEKKSNVQDIDIAEVYSKLTQLYYDYQASMKIASQSMGMSLLNYI